MNLNKGMFKKAIILMIASILMLALTGCLGVGESKENKELEEKITKVNSLINKLYTEEADDINTDVSEDTLKEIEQFFKETEDVEKSEENQVLYKKERDRYTQYLDMNELENKIDKVLTEEQIKEADIKTLKKELSLYKDEFTKFFDRHNEKMTEVEKELEKEQKKVTKAKAAIKKLMNKKDEVKEDVTEKDAKKIKKLIDAIKDENEKKKLEKDYKKIVDQIKENQENEVKVSKKSGIYYVSGTSTLNVREGDSTKFSVIGSLNNGDKVEVTGETEKGWYQFKLGKKEGYASSNYLSDKKPDNENEKTNNVSGSNNSKSSGNSSGSKGNTSSGNSSSSNNKDTSTSNSSKKSSGSSNKQSSNSDGNQNVVDKMNNLGNSQQVILVTTKGMDSYQGQVRTFEKNSNGKWNQKLSATAYVGKNGFANNKREGDLRTPTGKYSIGHAFGHGSKPNTRLSFKQGTSNDVWVDDSNSKFYNTWQNKNSESKDWNSAEPMNHELYKHGFVINYNTGQTPNAGSAIFMHVARAGTGYTTGCVATGEGNLLNIMSWINPDKNPVIIQDTESNLGKY